MSITYYFNYWLPGTLWTRSLIRCHVERLGPHQTTKKNCVLVAFAKRLPKIREIFHLHPPDMQCNFIRGSSLSSTSGVVRGWRLIPINKQSGQWIVQSHSGVVVCSLVYLCFTFILQLRSSTACLNVVSPFNRKISPVCNNNVFQDLPKLWQIDGTCNMR